MIWGHTVRAVGAKDEHQDRTSKASKATEATAEKKLKDAENKTTTTQDQHTTLRMTDQEGASVQPADINEGTPVLSTDTNDLEIGWRRAKNEHQDKASKATEATVDKKFKDAENKTTWRPAQ